MRSGGGGGGSGGGSGGGNGGDVVGGIGDDIVDIDNGSDTLVLFLTLLRSN
jgi:hypothetical protein